MSEGRILVVDNEPQIRRVMRTTLIAAGFEVDDAREGDGALDHLRSPKYDLVLLDINMPGMTGFETCRAIRAASDVPIIMLTVRSTERDKVEALESGADDYVTKPFSTPELLARIHAILRRKHTSAVLPPARESVGGPGGKEHWSYIYADSITRSSLSILMRKALLKHLVICVPTLSFILC